MNEQIQEIRYLVGEAWKGEYNSATPYGNANVVQDPTGLSVYRSLKPGNVGHPLTDANWWFCIINLSSIKAESDRIAALNQAIAQDEALRVAAEQLRQQKEAQREAAETQRNEAEQARISAEQQRVSAEQQRASQEQTRISQEQSRVTAEQGRVAAEAQRVQKEQLRENNEAQRVINETNRVAAEAERVAQYAADHQQAVADHDQYVIDNAQLTGLVERADADHTQAGNDHTRAESDHSIAVDDHTQAGNDHTRAESDHGIAADDHTQAGNDHTRAESDHTRAESDHAAVEVYVDSLGVFDLSKHNAVGGVLATYANLDAALTALNALESKYKYGGMSFKFVQSSDNKYVQFRCIDDDFTTDVTKWVVCGNETIEESPEWGEVVVDKNRKILYGVKTDGNFYFGAGCPPQVVAYVLTHINDVIAQLNLKVDKVSGKSLINEIYAATCNVIETPEYASVVVDENNKILEGFTSDGKKVVFADFIVKNLLSIGGEKFYVYEDKENRFEITIDSMGKIVSFRNKEGMLVENAGIKTPTLIIGNKNIGVALQALQEHLNTPNIVMPEKIYVLEGTKVQVFKSQFAPVHNPENYEMRIQLVSQAVSKPWGDNFDFLYEYEVDMTDSDFILKFGLYNDITGLTLSDINTKFVHVAKAQSPSSVKNVVCIGDSFTGADMWVSELRRLLTGEVCNWYSDSADSDIVADTLTNINFIGTQNAVSGKTPCEGYAGEDYQFFCGKGGGIHPGVGPFVNPNTGKVDFDYYINTGNVKGTIQNPASGSKIDYAIIILGTNQHHDVKYIKTIWNALLSHNPNIKVIIAGQCFAIPYGDKSPIRDKKTYVGLSEKAQNTNILLNELCSQTDYKDNFLWCDYNVRVDAFNNMGYELVYPNIRNKDDEAKIRRSLDDVHPSREGYFQIADAIRPAFHYWFLS